MVSVTDGGVISGIRVTHDRANVDEIEAATPADPTATLSDLLAADPVSEAFVLSTCNRVEAYVVTDDPLVGRNRLEAFFAGVPDHIVVETGHEASLRHLLAVAAGLNSLVLGEDQIIGQLRDAYEAARGVDALGPVLDDAIVKAIHVGERARTETTINEGVVSIGSAAVRLAGEHCELEGETALVVGAGEMGKLAARALADADVGRIYVANRTRSRAEQVATDVDADARAVELNAIEQALAEAGVVVTATGSDEPLLGPDDLAHAGETLVVDVGQPRNVDPTVTDCEGVTCYDLDALESVTDETLERRRAAAERVEGMIGRELDRLLDHQKRRRADEVIGAMYESAERIKTRELETAFARLETGEQFNEDQREVIESLADALVSQLMAAPTKSLRDAAANDDWETIHIALRLFDPDFGDDAPAFVQEILSGTISDDVMDDASIDASASVEDD